MVLHRPVELAGLLWTWPSIENNHINRRPNPAEAETSRLCFSCSDRPQNATERLSKPAAEADGAHEKALVVCTLRTSVRLQKLNPTPSETIGKNRYGLMSFLIFVCCD